MQLSADGLQFIKTQEDCELEAYQDEAGVWTIGYGHTRNVYQGLSIDQTSAEQLLIQDLYSCIQAVNKLVTVPLTQGQFDALVSFEFNTGALAGSSLLRVLNYSQYYQAFKVELRRWVHITINGQKIISMDLVNRRNAESAMALQGTPQASL